MSSIRIGVGGGFADDRLPPAIFMAERGDVDYLVFEGLAERTLARENLSKSKNAEAGFTPRLLQYMGGVLPAAIDKGFRVVTNMGAANPGGAVKAVRKLASELGLRKISCAAVLGDDVSSLVRSQPGIPLMETGEPLESILPRVVSANAYLGADAVCAALDTGAQIVITGRVGDPSLFLGAAMHHFRWSYDDWPRMAAGTLVGHMLECSDQVTGGCFADPGKKEVPNLAGIGHPFADIDESGIFTIGKPDGTGGRVDAHVCAEQLLYEIHDPTTYITPDCVLDISGVMLTETARDRVRVTGAAARPRTPTYKVIIGYHDGYIGEGQVSYAGINAVGRAKLAAEIVQQRLKDQGFGYDEVRVDLIGMSSLHGMTDSRVEPYEVRLRIAMRTNDRKAAEAVGFEMRALHVSGPSGGGGASDPIVREILAVQSLLLDRRKVAPEIVFYGDD